MKLDIIYNEDCLEGMKRLPNESIDMALCDMPYGTTACKWDIIIPLKPLWEQLKRVIKSNGVIVLTASQPFTTILITSNMKMFKYEWIWLKTKPSGFQNAKKMPMKKHENVIVFYSRKPTYNPQGLRKLDKPIKSGRIRIRNEHKLGVAGKPNYYTEWTNYPNSIIEIANPSGRGHLHSTQKPVALMEYLIKTYTNEGAVVLDFAMGSGTTAVACKRLGRHYIGFEINPEYCQIAKNRLKNIQLQLFNP